MPRIAFSNYNLHGDVLFYYALGCELSCQPERLTGRRAARAGKQTLPHRMKPHSTRFASLPIGVRRIKEDKIKKAWEGENAEREKFHS